ncbi:carbohydrate ABC transporter permease [Neobacillus bataviensis]|uniref:carbohydrate ABC transporter permease n=1 Tax=Neobacillus bataviensis TaxID=220685 RepID=UPI001CBAD795|nr:sugar ABC transporter permease [Neobacillus bataviensis]
MVEPIIKEDAAIKTAKKSSFRSDKLKRQIVPYFFVLPNFVIFFTFIVVPAIVGLYYSFTDYDGLSEMNFVGIENYKEVFQSSEYWKIFANTFKYAFAVVPLIFICSLGIAMLLIKEIKVKGFFRAIFYWPTMISAIIVGVTWKWIFGDSFGVLNYLIESLGFKPIKWLSDPVFANMTVVVGTIWARIGFFMVIFMAGLQSIPTSYYEAAQMDGASKFRMFRSITLPLLKPTSFLVLILLLIESFKQYPLVLALTGGGPAKQTTYLVQYIYEFGFKKGELGYASAMSVVLFVVIAIFTVIQFKWTKGGTID